MTVAMIAAVAPDGLIGCAGKVPWHYPLDMAFFKKTTVGSTVIMGRKTWDSLPEKFRPLPDRKNLVLTRDIDIPRGCSSTTWCENLEVALKVAPSGKDIWIIGGGEIYRLALPYALKIVLTLVPPVGIDNMISPIPHSPATDLESPVYFPFLSPRYWNVSDIQPHDDRALRVVHYWRRVP